MTSSKKIFALNRFVTNLIILKLDVFEAEMNTDCCL